MSPFFTVIQFYSNIDKKRVCKSPQEISTRATFRNILTNLKKQDKTKRELPLDMVSISASRCRTNTIVRKQHQAKLYNMDGS